MNGSRNENGRVSDSGYPITCVSQSQRSSGSSLSKNSKHSESSGYCGGNTPTVGSSNYALPRPISKRKSKEYKEKKSQTTTTTKTSIGDVKTKVESQIKSSEQNDLGTFDSNGSSSDFTSICKKAEEVAGIELADDGRLKEHNGNSNSTESEGRIDTITNSLEDTTSYTNAGGFGVVISMMTGLVVDTTPSLKTILGYTRESWMDQSFIGFIHPKDKQTFTDHLAKNMASTYEDEGLNGVKRSMFCCLRKNDERKSTAESTSDDNSSSAKKTNIYLPFHLTTTIECFRELTNGNELRMMFLVMNAEPIVPVYKAPEEMIISAIFLTRHDPNCIMTHADVNVVQYFGWMPQDMIGRSLFEFYHPEDLPFLKDVYETVVKMEGTPFRSKPYRFAAQNGDYVVLETEWSSFVNPWRGKIEFVAGHHRILRGPENPNVFQPPLDSQRNLLANISDEVFKESKIIEGEIRALLDEKIRSTEDNDACKITSRCRGLHTFVKKLLREDNLPEPVPKKRSTAGDRSFLKHDSVILGAISPHHEYCDSKSSSETPPSYNQLNYNEKITRFFDSKLFIPTAYDSDENNINSSSPSDEDGGKTNSNLTGRKEATLSTKNLSSGSINRTSHDSREDNGILTYRSVNTTPMTGNSKIPTLTESVLNKHNRYMENLLVQEYKKRQSTIKNNRKHDRACQAKGEIDMANNKNSKDDIKMRGAKRPSNDDVREKQQCKVSKYDDDLRASAPQPAALSTPMEMDDAPFSREQPKQNTDMSQPLEVTAAAVPSHPPHPHFCIPRQNNGIQQTSELPGFPPFVPIYYVGIPRICNALVQPDVPPISLRCTQNGQPQQSTYVSYAPGLLAGVIYPPTTCAPVPVTTMYRPFVIPGPVPVDREHLNSASGTVQQESSLDRMTRPASQATSIKVELASTMGRSDSSKKLLSLGEHLSTCVGINGECSSLVPNANRETIATSQFESSLEDSSDSSFYGSFISASDGNNPNLNLEIIAQPPQTPQSKSKTHQHASEEKKQLDQLRKGPPWQEGVQMTQELIYKYRITPKPLNEVLEADMRALKTFRQPEMVKDQLAQLYADMGLGKIDNAEGLLRCEFDGSADSASGSSGDAPRKIISESNRVRNDMGHDIMTMIQEGNALPSP